MKKQFLYTLCLILFSIQLIHAQEIASTNRPYCYNCAPNDWVTGQQSTESAVSSLTNLAGTVPWVKALPAPSTGQGAILTLANSTTKQQYAYTMIHGLRPGSKYSVKFSISTARVNTNIGASPYAASARIRINNGVYGDKTYIFNPGINTDEWITDEITFTTSVSSVEFRFTSIGTSSAVSYTNLHISMMGDAVKTICNLDQKQVVTVDTVRPICPTKGYNVTSLVNIKSLPAPSGTSNGVAPGFAVEFYDNPTHSGNSVSTVYKSSTVYAFVRDKVTGCYNTDNSTAKMVIVFPEEQQVKLRSPLLYHDCVGAKTNLNIFVNGDSPDNYEVVWFKSSVHGGIEEQDPTAVLPGTYYAFYYNKDLDCYLTDKSTSKVVITAPNELQVPLSSNIITKMCPEATANLNDVVSGSVPLGLKVHWLDKNEPGPNVSIFDATVAKPGTYYAFYYDLVNKCYKALKSTSSVLVQTYPEFQVGLSDTTAINSCPEKSVDLTKLVSGSVPNYEVVWFNNNTHTGFPVKSPTMVDVKGTYYAFYYNKQDDCFNPAVSTSKVDVNLVRCDLDEPKITLNTKVFLQGAMGGTVMHNQLQTYFPDGTGLLPVSDPYDGSSTYDDVYNVQGVAGPVVDWVRVEVRSSEDPTIILEAQNLLLRTDGKIVNTEGLDPVFKSQASLVHLVVKHRNHLPVMSNAVDFASASASYDFTTALSQAMNAFGDPEQMVQVNGTWCMIAGDVQQDLSIDNVDLSLFYNAFNQGDFDLYSDQDLNLDGVVDNQDIFYFNNSFNVGYFSSIINY